MSQGHTRVQFRQDQKHLLVVHEVCIATFEGPNLNHCKQVSETYLPESVYALLNIVVYLPELDMVYALLKNTFLSART